MEQFYELCENACGDVRNTKIASLKERYSKSLVQQRLKTSQELSLETYVCKKPGFSRCMRSRTNCYNHNDSSLSLILTFQLHPLVSDMLDA